MLSSRYILFVISSGLLFMRSDVTWLICRHGNTKLVLQQLQTTDTCVYLHSQVNESVQLLVCKREVKGYAQYVSVRNTCTYPSAPYISQPRNLHRHLAHPPVVTWTFCGGCQGLRSLVEKLGVWSVRELNVDLYYYWTFSADYFINTNNNSG